MPKIKLEILIDDERWNHIPRLKLGLKMAADAVYDHLPKKLRRPLEVTLLLTSNRHMRRLNYDFRGIDKPTNVLSFPQFIHGKLSKKSKSAAPIFAGDISMGYQYIVAESKENHKILINHCLHLLIHGILHIMGYDHISSAEAVQMEKLETRIMASLKLPNPYIPQPREPKAR